MVNKACSVLSRDPGEKDKPDETTEQKNMTIGICIPSRGLIFSKVLERVERERKGYETKLYISSDLPIPNGHNELCEKALEDKVDYILLVEEDVAIPAGTFEKLLAANADIACIDYGVNGWSCITRNTKGEILWCGLGCTLIARRVFEALRRPFFRTDMTLTLPDMVWKQLPEEYVLKRNYGSLDIWFCCQAREKGFTIKQVDGECEHLKLIKLGERERNHGIHEIGLKERIMNKQVLD